MRATSTRHTQSTIAAGALVLAMTAATPTVGDLNLVLTVQTVSIHGNELVIAVSNPTTRTYAGTVVARVLLRGGEVSAMAPVVAAAGQTAKVKLVLPSPVLGVLPLGVVVDDGVPF